MNQQDKTIRTSKMMCSNVRVRVTLIVSLFILPASLLTLCIRTLLPRAGKVFGTKRNYIVAEAEYQEGEGEEEEEQEGEEGMF